MLLVAKRWFLLLSILISLRLSYFIYHAKSQQQQKNHSAPPITSFSYIKLHRVGSGTMHNVLIRFALRHNKFIALADCPYFQIFPNQASVKYLLPPPTNPGYHGYDMLIDHAIYNKSATQAFLPPDTVYISQIRHPFGNGFSVYEHFQGHRHFKIN